VPVSGTRLVLEQFGGTSQFEAGRYTGSRFHSSRSQRTLISPKSDKQYVRRSSTGAVQRIR
jgi:hypothetical protein